MRIVHILLGGAFSEEMSYQENILSKENRKAGHEVTIIASCYKWEHGKITETPEEDKWIDGGIRLIRIKLDKIINDFISTKLRKSRKLLSYLREIRPDVILHHGVQGLSLLTVGQYKKRNPSVMLYADNHADKNNSASNWLSWHIQHKVIFKTVLKLTLKHFEKVFYVSYEGKDFLKELYHVPENKMEFYPLGGTIISTIEKAAYREQKRKELNIGMDDVLLCHSGKMDAMKRTYELLVNFQKVEDRKLKLILIGTFSDDVREKVLPLIEQDDRIIYIGWLSSKEMLEVIAAADLYLQPGSQSATMQNALCVGTPVLFTNVKSHQPYMKGNAFVIDDCSEMESIFRAISENPTILDDMSNSAYKLAIDLLDYEKLAARITHAH